VATTLWRSITICQNKRDQYKKSTLHYYYYI